MRKTIAGALLLVACGGGTSSPDAGSIDAMGPPYWSPAPGDAKNWDIQLTAPINTSAQRTMYVLDLFAVVPAPVLLYYNDGHPLTVPAGGTLDITAQFAMGAFKQATLSFKPGEPIPIVAARLQPRAPAAVAGGPGFRCRCPVPTARRTGPARP